MKPKNNFLILIVLLFVAGCNAGSGQKTTEIDVRVGFNGLMMDFMKNTPPVKVFEGDTFPVIARLANSGAYSIAKDNAFLSLGVEKDYTQSVKLEVSDRIKKVEVPQLQGKINDEPASFGLEGKSTINPNGDFELVSYNLKAGKVDPQSEAHRSTVIATVCYPYQTVLSTTACIDTDLSNTRPGKKACRAQDLVFSSGQGAPVAVTKVEVNMLPKVNEQNEVTAIKPQFLIYIENRGKGDVIKSDTQKDFCTNPKVPHENLNIVLVSASLGGKEIDCTTIKKDFNNNIGNYAKLLDKKALARCVLKDEDAIARANDNYLSPLRIQLDYSYTQSILANYFIQKATGQ